MVSSFHFSFLPHSFLFRSSLGKDLAWRGLNPCCPNHAEAPAPTRRPSSSLIRQERWFFHGDLAFGGSARQQLLWGKSPTLFLPFFLLTNSGGLLPQEAQEKSSIRRQWWLLGRASQGQEEVTPPSHSPQTHLNQVEVLLEWKRQPRLLPLTINGLPENDINVPL